MVGTEVEQRPGTGAIEQVRIGQCSMPRGSTAETPLTISPLARPYHGARLLYARAERTASGADPTRTFDGSAEYCHAVGKRDGEWLLGIDAFASKRLGRATLRWGP